MDNLEQKLKSDFNLDIRSDKNFGMNRYIQNPEKPYYTILIQLEGKVIRAIDINGITGEVMSDSILNYKRVN